VVYSSDEVGIKKAKDLDLATELKLLVLTGLSPNSPSVVLAASFQKGETKDFNLKKWEQYLIWCKELNRHIRGDTSDGDPSFLSAMKAIHSLDCLETTKEDFMIGPDNIPIEISISRLNGKAFIAIQDIFHVGTKLRNRIFNHDLLLASASIKFSHLEECVGSQINHSTYNVKDKMNVASAREICDIEVQKIMNNSLDKQATASYLKFMYLASFGISESKSTEELTYNISYSYWFARIWQVIFKGYISNFKMEIEKDNLEKKKKKALVNAEMKKFLTTNQISCIFLNFSSLVTFLLEADPTFRIDPENIGSQQCEHYFRDLRAINNSPNQLNASFNFVEGIQRLGRIDVLAKLKAKNNFQLLNHAKHLKRKEKSILIGSVTKDSLTQIITDAYLDVKKELLKFDLDQSFFTSLGKRLPMDPEGLWEEETLVEGIVFCQNRSTDKKEEKKIINNRRNIIKYNGKLIPIRKLLASITPRGSGYNDRLSRYKQKKIEKQEKKEKKDKKVVKEDSFE